jgi:transcriptional regulator with XRE-family HTH domain
LKDDPDLLALGREARRLREALDLTQEEQADRAASTPTISAGSSAARATSA